MNSTELIDRGNALRAEHKPEEALKCYAEVILNDPDHPAAWNNYGNVLRECGRANHAIPFLQHAIQLDPNNVTGQFNLAVAYLLLGDYQRGWPQYETRWNYEHLAGTEPKFSQPRWRGEDIKGKTILIVGEQGHGDNIQFMRYSLNLKAAGAVVNFQTTDGLIPLLNGSDVFGWVGPYSADPGEFDYWVPIMSIPGILGITLDNMPKSTSYISANAGLAKAWLVRLGPKTKMRVGFSWSGRRDSWLNQHKGMPFETMCDMIRSNPQYEWINLQVDSTAEEENILKELGVTLYPGSVNSFADTAALMTHLDVVISVDTAVAHLAGSLGRPTWIMLNWFGTDWRWLLGRDDSPWYPSARLFRQPSMGDWTSVTKKISQYLSWFKV
jgi:hypothetical protein